MFSSPASPSTNRSCPLSLNTLTSGSPSRLSIPTFKPSNRQPTPFSCHAAPPQLTENTAALNPASANLDAASSLTPLFATLTKNTRGWGAHPSSQIFPFRNPATLCSLLSTISFRTLRLRAVLARRIRTYEKRGGVRVWVSLASAFARGPHSRRDRIMLGLRGTPAYGVRRTFQEGVFPNARTEVPLLVGKLVLPYCTSNDHTQLKIRPSPTFWLTLLPENFLLLFTGRTTTPYSPGVSPPVACS